MGIAYKELFRVNRPIYDPGPGGFFPDRLRQCGNGQGIFLCLSLGSPESNCGF